MSAKFQDDSRRKKASDFLKQLNSGQDFLAQDQIYSMEEKCSAKKDFSQISTSKRSIAAHKFLAGLSAYENQSSSISTVNLSVEMENHSEKKYSSKSDEKNEESTNIGTHDVEFENYQYADASNVRNRTVKKKRKEDQWSFSKYPRVSNVDFHSGSRIFIMTKNSYIAVFSVVKLCEDKKVEFSLSKSQKLRNEYSYAHLLNPATQHQYDPCDLDDPELKTGKHRTVVTLPGYMVSVIQYAKASDLKNELNIQFRQKHENLDPEMTLSKIRNLKMRILRVALSQDIELSSVAKSYVFLEKLILKNFVTKIKRKVIGGVCLLLAVKINDLKDVKYSEILSSLEKWLDVSTQRILELEFPVFAELEFNLHIPQEEYMPHMDRLLALLDFNSVQDYLQGKLFAERDLQYL